MVNTRIAGSGPEYFLTHRECERCGVAVTVAWKPGVKSTVEADFEKGFGNYPFPDCNHGYPSAQDENVRQVIPEQA